MAEPGHRRESGQHKAGAPSPRAALSCVTAPSFSDACGLINSRYSCLAVKTHRRHLALSPKYLHQKRSGIKELLSAELLKYNVGLAGVPVAYDNIKLIGGLGDIHDDIGFIHVNIEADFVIFQPECRQRLVGVVNKKAPTHIGCLVHGCFNASIPRPFKISVEAWQQMKVNIGDELEFEVFRLDSDTAGVFFIRGKLDWRLEAEAVQRMKEISEEQNANLPDNEVQNGSKVAEEAVVGETSILPEGSPKRIGKRLLEETLSQNECIENQEDTNLSLEEAPKKRRKKHGHLEVLPQDHSVEAMEISSIHQDSLRNTDNDVAVDSSVGGLDDMLVVPSSQERKAKKSKKKKRKDHLDHESSVNSIITEESSIMGDSMLEGLGTELGTTKKKHKKHKNASMILDEDPTAASASSLETPTDNFRIQQKTSKKKRHKHHPDLESSVNIVTDESSITGASMLEGLGTQPATTEKKHKKHKNTSMILDEDPIAGAASFLGTPAKNVIQQETSKKKRHKHHPDLESSVSNMAEESSIMADSMLEVLGTQPGTPKKKHKKHKNTSMILAEDPTAAPFSSLSPTPNFIIQQETSKKKRHKHHPDLESSVHNGMMEESSITGDSTLEGLGTEPGTTEKKRRKKLKNTSMIL